MLAFKPNLFFNELEKISRYKRQTLEKALAEAQRQKLAEKHQNIIRLTGAGKNKLAPFVAKKLPASARLMVIFDIPEDKAKVRTRFRRTLRVWHFEQVQESVWVTEYNHRKSVKDLAAELEINQHIMLFECAPV